MKETLDRDDYLTQTELTKLLAAARSRRDKALLLVAYRHGLRASEVGMVRAGDVDLARRKIYCRRLKGSYSGEQLLGDDEVKLLRPLAARAARSEDPLFLSRKGNPISRKRLDQVMKELGRAAGIPEKKRHFHVLKHSFGVHLMEAGADLVLAQDLLGHKNIANTRIYARLTSARRDQLHRAALDTRRIVGMSSPAGLHAGAPRGRRCARYQRACQIGVTSRAWDSWNNGFVTPTLSSIQTCWIVTPT